MAVVAVTWREVLVRARHIAEALDGEHHRFSGVYGIPRGGVYPAIAIAARLRLPMSEEFEPGMLVVDDLVESGETLRRLGADPADVRVLFAKFGAPQEFTVEAKWMGDLWLEFPWERTADERPAADALLRLAQAASGYQDPSRVLAGLKEAFLGLWEDPAAAPAPLRAALGL